MTTTTDFIKACHEGSIDEAMRLLPEADINGANEVGQGALLTFYPEVTDFLLASGADPDAQYNENGASVLAGLCHVRNVECVRRLLKAGADLFATDWEGRTALEVARRNRTVSGWEAPSLKALKDATRAAARRRNGR